MIVRANPMNRRTIRRLATRLTGALLALAMLAGPTLARVQVAEICRMRCYPAAAKGAHGGCCGKASESATQTQRGGEHDPADPAGDASLKYCPGCNGRPLVADTPRLIRYFTTEVARALDNSQLEGNWGVAMARESVWPSTCSAQSISGGIERSSSTMAAAS